MLIRPTQQHAAMSLHQETGAAASACLAEAHRSILPQTGSLAGGNFVKKPGNPENSS
jgi:hypothetical protein